VAKPDKERWKAEGWRHWLPEAFRLGLARSLDSMTGSTVSGSLGLELAPAEVSRWGNWAAPVWCQLEMEGMAGAALAVGCPQPTAHALGELIAGNPGAGPASFLELASQAAAVMSEALTAQRGSRAQFSAPRQIDAPKVLDFGVHIGFSLQGAPQALAFVPTAELIESLPESGDGVPAAPSATQAVPAAPRNLDLLLDVELPVCVTFGRTQLPLKDILKLSSGSIVELNRLANEPVELLINNAVIARGEVVVVDGNYGIRVTEIVSRQERIRTIF